MTPTATVAALRRLEGRTTSAKKAEAKAKETLAARDELAAELADKGVPYASLATAMGITVDGVTYVLRKVRKRRK